MRTLPILIVAFLALGARAQPTVVTSIFPYYDLVRQIAGGAAEVILLVPPGASPHTFEPTPRAVARVAEADLIILNGGLDLWLEDLIAASGSEAPVLEILEVLDLDPIAPAEHGDEAERDGRAGAEEPGGGFEGNPHVWLDPLLMVQAVGLIAEELAAVDPAGAGRYLGNGAALATELAALQQELAEILAPVAGAPFVPFHDAWPYFARRFGLDLVVEIEPFPGREASPRYLAEALALIEASGARAVFGELQLASRPAEVVAETAGVALFVLDPIGGGEHARSYQALLRYNAAILREGLGP